MENENGSESIFEGSAPSDAPESNAKEKTPALAWKVVVVVVLIIAVGFVIALKRSRGPSAPEEGAPPPIGTAASSLEAALPRLVDLGSTTCIPCKMMAPILEELKKEYAGKLTVEFIDVQEDLAAGHIYSIRVIPTQIFFDAEEKELFRHEGFFPKEEILAKWKELGVNLQTDDR